MDNKLKVWDKIYTISWNKILRTDTIDRVTKTMAFSGDIKWRIWTYMEWHCSLVANTRWDRSSYLLETTELIEKLKKQRLVSKISVIDWDKLSTEKLIEIYNLTK